jgi:hypothetical protein
MCLDFSGDSYLLVLSWRTVSEALCPGSRSRAGKASVGGLKFESVF